MVASLQHPTDVVSVIRRLAALMSVLTLCVGNVAVCAGWQGTPEARMACCMNGPSCPMHESESHHRGSAHQVTQAQADSCCAAGERNDAATSQTTFVSTGTVALGVASVPVVVAAIVPALQQWRAYIPLPVSPVPKHLLLSVLLV